MQIEHDPDAAADHDENQDAGKGKCRRILSNVAGE
tara:strand:+ start:542 stop:646 length:105 start_codon:yes stop_codon:yes gene_type:complete